MVAQVCYIKASPDRKAVRRTARKTTTSTEVKRRYNERVYGRIYLQLPKETVEAFKAKCEKLGVSQAGVLLDAITKFLEGK